MDSSDSTLSAEVDIEVPFHDGDPMGVTWHGNYFRYFELARCVLLDRIDYNYIDMEKSGYAWPIVDTRVKFLRPTVFRQRLRVSAEIEEFENRLKIGYVITDIESGERVTKGYTIQVAVDKATREMCYVSPPILIEKISAASS